MPCRDDRSEYESEQTWKKAQERADMWARNFCDAGRILYELRSRGLIHDNVTDHDLETVDALIEKWKKHRESDRAMALEDKDMQLQEYEVEIAKIKSLRGEPSQELLDELKQLQDAKLAIEKADHLSELF